MRRPLRIPVLAAVLTFGAAGVALAHDTWLLPATLRTPVGRTVTLSLTSGMAFPADDFAIKPARVKLAVVRLAGRTTALRAPRSAPLALRFRWTPARAGVATLAVELAPKTLSLTDAQVAEYLDEIGAARNIRDAWAQLPAPRRWRESYTKHASSFVRVGNPAADASWATPIGLGLEIVPERDPTLLRAGDTLGVRVLRAGAPLAGFVVSARPDTVASPAFVTTGGDGRARVVLPRAGRWLLAGTDLRRSAQPGLEWESDFITVTVSVQR